MNVVFAGDNLCIAKIGISLVFAQCNPFSHSRSPGSLRIFLRDDSNGSSSTMIISSYLTEHAKQVQAKTLE